MIEEVVVEEIYIYLPEELHDFPGADGKLNDCLHGVVQAKRVCITHVTKI